MSALEDDLSFQIKACLTEQPVREFKPIDGRQFRVDFCFTALKIVVEVEGGVWTEKSRHRTGEGYKRDVEKYNLLSIDGWMLIRVTGDDIKSGKAITWIERAINKRKGV
jgi:very-short-patch-repair endonuclease